MVPLEGGGWDAYSRSQFKIFGFGTLVIESRMWVKDHTWWICKDLSLTKTKCDTTSSDKIT